MDFITGHYIPGSNTSKAYDYQREVTEKEKSELWFIKPLTRMKNDDGFACLIVCFPLLECIIRHELKIPDHVDAKFSDNSPELLWFAKFMTIPAAEARDVWDAFRNGLLHRAMVKGTLAYELTGKSAGRPASVVDGKVKIHVWDLRDEVVKKLEQHHRHLWSKDGNPLPKIFVNA